MKAAKGLGKRAGDHQSSPHRRAVRILDPQPRLRAPRPVRRVRLRTMHSRPSLQARQNIAHLECRWLDQRCRLRSLVAAWPNECGLSTVWYHVPTMVRTLDETVTVFGEGRIAKNSEVVNRINSVQAAWDHTRLAAAVAIRPSHRRSDTENAQGGGGRKRDESHLSTHGFLLLPRHDTDSRSGVQRTQELRHHQSVQCQNVVNDHSSARLPAMRLLAQIAGERRCR